MFVCNDEIIRCYFVLFFSFFVAFFVLVIAEELVRRKKRFLKYINLSACIKIEGLEEEDFFFLIGLLYKKSGNIQGRCIAMKYRFGPFLFVNLQVSVFILFFYFLFSTKDGAMYLSFLLLIAIIYNSYFVIVWSQTACHELK